MIMNNTYLITIFVSSLSLLFSFILLKKIKQSFRFFYYMFYFDIFKMTIN